MKKKRKKFVVQLFCLLGMTIGLGIMGYPIASDLWNKYRNDQIADEYENNVKELDKEQIDKMWADAKAYNDQHTVNFVKDVFHDNEDYVLSHPYDQLLNPTNDNVMGYIEIPKINVRLAIYHGIGEDVLSKGVGHVEGTSLPIGGIGTHTVLSGHRGLPSAKLFTDLDQMREGDLIYLHVLDKTMAYRVDKIDTVLPEDTSGLAIEPDSDLITLITCTPYGVNSHRLLVRGRRIDPVPIEQKKITPIEQVSSMPIKEKALAIGLVVSPVLLIVLVVSDKKKEKKKKQGK